MALALRAGVVVVACAVPRGRAALVRLLLLLL